MAARPRRQAIGVGLLSALAMSLPALVGPGCPNVGPGVIEMIEPGQGTPGGGTGNTPPTLTFTYPFEDVAVTVGDVVTITWVVTDPDSNAAITLLLDPDRTYGNGNEVVVLPLILANDPNGGSYALDTSSLSAASYRVIARVTDGVNPEQIVAADGRLMLYGAGLLPGNVSPTIVVTQPTNNRGVSQGDVVTIEYCGRDPDDDGQEPAKTPQILLLLDLDDDPTNDLDLTGAGAEAALSAVCNTGYFPVEVKETSTSPASAYVLACLQDTDCTGAAQAQTFQFTVDVGTIPPRADGEPYRIRATMWDHANLPVSSYALGTISITVLGSGMIDLGSVGRTVSGTRFLGFNHGDQAGSTGADLGDVDGDGVDDFCVVSRFGRGYETANTGTASIIMGLDDGGKFASEIPLNSIGTLYTGSLLVMDETTGTEGITSVTRLGDINADGKPEIVVGTPYVEILYDDHDDDPQDKGDLCYGDSRPNPLSTAPNQVGDDDIAQYDHRETSLCSNDLDIMRETPINSGYAFLVKSELNLTTGVRYLGDLGQRHTGLVGGARFRGAWYPRNIHDYTLTEQPNMLDPQSRFGETVASMPPMTDTSLLISPRHGTTMLVSAPRAFDERGMVVVTPQHDFLVPENNAHSWPYYVRVADCCRTIAFPNEAYIGGAAIGDHLGYARPAGDYNLDGSRDIAMGSPGADRDGMHENGIVYVLFGRPDFPHSDDRLALDLQTLNPPRMEIRGVRDYDQFGTMQTIVGDINQDGLPDVGFSSGYADGAGGVDSGYIGIVFGGRRLTGENLFTVDQVATSQLPGVKIYGIQPNGHAGVVINNAGDFNGDGTDDLLIVAPDEVRTIGSIQRRGVAYLVFGGVHMMGNKTFNLSQVGTSVLPGIIFVSPYAQGSAEEAPIDWAGAAGDVNHDGFDDILIGVSLADYVNPLEPSQRRIDAGEMYLIYGNNTGSNTTR